MKKSIQVTSALLSIMLTRPAIASDRSLQVALKADVGRAADDEDVTCADLKSQPIPWGLMILGSSKDLAALEKKARKISASMKIPFSTEGYSIKNKREHYERANEGAYVPRIKQCENGKGCITIEKSSAYSKFTPELFIIVGGIVDFDANSLIAKFRKVVPDAYVKFSPMAGDQGGYGGSSGCLDWDVIVLARAANFKDATEVASAASKVLGIPFVKKADKEPEGFFSARVAPYPNITVERDDTYGELGDSKYYLVVGGELGEGQNPAAAESELFERYKKAVPKAFRIKRARHVCGS